MRVFTINCLLSDLSNTEISRKIQSQILKYVLSVIWMSNVFLSVDKKNTAI